MFTNIIPQWETFPNNIQTTPNYDFSGLAPLQPMHDLVYNDLGGTAGGAIDFNGGNAFPIPHMDSTHQWQFAGDFGNDSFWGFMNNYNP